MIGQLNRKITIVDRTTDQNEYGEPIDSFNEIASVWSSVKNLTGQELFTANQAHPESSTKFTIRYRPNIKPQMKINYGSRSFVILSVVNIKETFTFLEMTCREVL